MSSNKTRPTGVAPADFLASLDNPRRRADSEALLSLMRDVTGEPAVMWGASIVGFGRYNYRYESGRSGTFFLTGFSPRKANLVLYIMPGFSEYDTLLARLGKHKTGKSCLYVNRIEDIDLDVLRELISLSVAWMRERYPG